jgi:hypothetical protein
MPILSRRRFLVWVSSAFPVAIVARRADALGASWIREDRDTLRALARAILPSELGTDGVARVTNAFQRWIDGYREQTELVHGYGTSALLYSRPSPRARWASQLEQLGGGFASATVERRREIVTALLKDERLDRMPEVGSAPHVALGLLAFYYDRPEAADLCYEARIGREQCRPLAQSPRKPLPIAGSRA